VEQELTIEQALNVIDQARLTYNGNGKEHDLFRKALLTLAKALKSKEES